MNPEIGPARLSRGRLVSYNQYSQYSQYVSGMTPMFGVDVADKDNDRAARWSKPAARRDSKLGSADRHACAEARLASRLLHPQTAAPRSAERITVQS